MHGGTNSVSEPIKSISAVKPKREGGHSRAKKRRGGYNTQWKSVTNTLDAAVRALNNCPPERFDELVALIAANQKIRTPVTRLVYSQHLTPTQGVAARRFAEIIRKFERYHMAASSRSARSANLEPTRGVEDQELGRIHVEGRLKEYEAAAKVAMREYKRVTKVLDKFGSIAKDQLYNLCVFDQEPPAHYRADIGRVLSAIAREFGLEARS